MNKIEIKRATKNNYEEVRYFYHSLIDSLRKYRTVYKARGI